MSSVLLRAFYQWWIANTDEAFNSAGLCVNLGCFTWNTLYRSNFSEEEEEEYWEIHTEVQREMKQQFIQAGLDPSYPFNINYASYVGETVRCACHLNPQRIQWVLDRLAEGESE